LSLANGIVLRLRSDNQRGLFVLRPVRKDDILIIYDGPMLDHPTRYSIQIAENRHIEGTPESNAYLNPCSPTIRTRIWKKSALRPWPTPTEAQARHPES
jgi:hypothetical protein